VLCLQPERAGPPHRAPPELVAIGHDVLHRADGAAVAVLAAWAPAGGVAAEGVAGGGAGRLGRLRRALLGLDHPLQIILGVEPFDPEPYCRRHAEATRAEPLPALRRLAAALRASLRDEGRFGEVVAPRLLLALAEPPPSSDVVPPRRLTLGRPAGSRPRPPAADDPAQRAGLDARCARLGAALARAGVAVERVAGADLLRLVHRELRPEAARWRPLDAIDGEAGHGG
jgi:hypothetical protein